MTAQEAFREILALFYQRLARDPQARAAMRRVERQTAAFTDTAQLSERASVLLGEVFGEHVLDVPEELREAVCTALLRERYDTMNGILADVQEAADEALGLTLDAAHAPFPAERVQTVAHSLIDPGVTAATIQRRANKPVATVARSFHDDFIETNAKKRSDLGLRCHITRETDGKCCQWCDGLAGRYVYGRHPGDIFRRHDNCGCTVTYEEGRQRQDVWTKRSWERVDPEEVAAGAPEPTVFSREDAAAMEESLLSGLTLAGERDIMKVEGYPDDHFDRKARPYTYDEDLKAVNPNYAPKTIYGRNCQRCVPTYYLRRQGYDVEALPVGEDPAIDERLMKYPECVWRKNGSPVIPKSTRNSRYFGKPEIEDFMKPLPDGAMCEVRCTWASGDEGHVFIAQKVNGKVRYIDPQTGENDVSRYFKDMKQDKTTFWRIDDATVDDGLIQFCCKNK